MRVVGALLLLIAFVAMDGILLLPLLTCAHGDGHFPSGTVTVAGSSVSEPVRGRTFRYDVSFSTVDCRWRAIGPTGWGCSVHPDMTVDVDGRKFDYTVDDYQAVTSLAAAQVYERELVPRFGASAIAVRGEFVERGSIHVDEPAAVPYVGSLLVYGLPLLQLGVVAWAACRRKP